MNKILMILAGLIVMAGIAYAKDLNVEKKVGDMTVKAVIERTPLRVGDNIIFIELFDREGNATTDAEIAVYYYMPSMPSMNYEVKALSKEKKYEAVIKPTMPGEWTADIRANTGDEGSFVVSLGFDAE